MLEILSPELLLAIQLCLDTPRDLRNLIAASPANLCIFQRHSRLVLTNILSNAIHPVAMPSALAVLQVPPPDRGRTSLHPRTLKPILDNYFNGGYDQLPEDKAGLVRLERLYSRALFLAKEFAARAWQKIRMGEPKPDPKSTWYRIFGCQGTGDQLRDSHWGTQENSHPFKSCTADQALDDPADPHLSSNETARLLRAFLRFELYCKLFPGCGRWPIDESEDGYFITAGQQNEFYVKNGQRCSFRTIS